MTPITRTMVRRTTNSAGKSNFCLSVPMSIEGVSLGISFYQVAIAARTPAFPPLTPGIEDIWPKIKNAIRGKIRRRLIKRFMIKS